MFIWRFIPGNAKSSRIAFTTQRFDTLWLLKNLVSLAGVLQKHKWENAMTVDKKSWGFRREANLEDFLTIHELISTLAETVR